MKTKKRYVVVLLVVTGALCGAEARAQCFVDSPDCWCFWDTGAWDPLGEVLDVAFQTLNTVESCVDDGGKPFYQMQMGINDASLAQQYAPALFILKRSPWCTETVAYWHLEAQRPYLTGYSTWWHPSWQLGNASAIRMWYLMASAFGERGRWIPATALDLDNFAPGYNAPCPGAYQQIMGYIPQLDWWLGNNKAHSQVVDWMTVYHRPDGTVISFDLGIIEGNSQNRVRNDRVLTDAPRYTPQGGMTAEDFIGGAAQLRKIRGWGIDLGADGQPLADWSRIYWVEVPPDIPAPFPEFHPVPDTDMIDQAELKKNMDFAEAVGAVGGPAVRFGDGPEMVMELPSSRIPWTVEDTVFEADLASVYVKYPKPLPYPVGIVEMDFSGADVPERVTVEAKEYGRENLPGHPHGKLRNREASMELAEGMHTAILSFDKGVRARKFRVELKRRADRDGNPIRISSLNFHAYVDPKDDDSGDNE